MLIITHSIAIKEALEDFYRHRADKRNNTEQFQVIRDGEEQTIFSQDIRPGDIVHVVDGQNFPADLVVLSTAPGDGTCFLQTANLDGM